MLFSSIGLTDCISTFASKISVLSASFHDSEILKKSVVFSKIRRNSRHFNARKIRIVKLWSGITVPVINTIFILMTLCSKGSDGHSCPRRGRARTQRDASTHASTQARTQCAAASCQRHGLFTASSIGPCFSPVCEF